MAYFTKLFIVVINWLREMHAIVNLSTDRNTFTCITLLLAPPAFLKGYSLQIF